MACVPKAECVTALPTLHRVACACLLCLACAMRYRVAFCRRNRLHVTGGVHPHAFVDVHTRAHDQVNKTFDTWDSITEANALAAQLSRFTPEHTVVITSFDAWERCFNHAAAQELTRCGIDGAVCFYRAEMT